MPKGGEPMPRKPKRPCSHPGCPKLTDERFCEEHEKLEAKRYEKYDRAPDTKCEQCLEEGRLTEAEQVHHIKPLAEGGDHSDGNLMSLCSSCHAKIHAKRGDRWHTSKAEYP